MAGSTEKEERRRRLLLFVLPSVGLVLALMGGYELIGNGSARATVTPHNAVPGARPVVTRPLATVSGVGQVAANGTASGVSAGDPRIAVTSQVLGRLGPGAPAALAVTVRNRSDVGLVVTAVSARITSVSASTCSITWYHASSFAGSRALAPRGQMTVSLVLTFDDLPTVNQDSCEGARYTYAFRAEATQR